MFHFTVTSIIGVEKLYQVVNDPLGSVMVLPNFTEQNNAVCCTFFPSKVSEVAIEALEAPIHRYGGTGQLSCPTDEVDAAC